jgi:hypothetical protein
MFEYTETLRYATTVPWGGQIMDKTEISVQDTE